MLGFYLSILIFVSLTQKLLQINDRFIEHNELLTDHLRFVVVPEKPTFERNAFFDFFKIVGQNVMRVKPSAEDIYDG